MMLKLILRCPFQYLPMLPGKSDHMSPLLYAVQKVEHLTPRTGRVGMKCHALRAWHFLHKSRDL